MMRCNPFSSARESCAVLLAISVILLLLLAPSCPAQLTQADRTTDALGTSASSSQGSSLWADASLPHEQTMPAAQLVQILEGNPEAMLEVKALVASSAQEQGISLDADSLTDQQVYAQIGKNDELRATVTRFLRGRGYLTEQEDFPQAAARRPRDMEGAFGGAGDAVDDSPGNEGTLYSDSNDAATTGKIALRQVNIQPDA